MLLHGGHAGWWPVDAIPCKCYFMWMLFAFRWISIFDAVPVDALPLHSFAYSYGCLFQ